MIRNYFKIAFRNIMKNKAFSFINVIGLTIGLSASFIISLMVYYEYTFDNFHKDEERIYRVVSDFFDPEGRSTNSGVTTALEDAIQENSNFEVVSGFYIERPSKVENREANVEKKWPKNVIFTDKDYFDILEYNFIAGNKDFALNDPKTVVLTEKRAQEYFPNQKPTDIVGKTLIYNDSLNIKVTAIVEDLPGRTDFVFQEFVSSPTLLSTRLRGNFLNKNWVSTSSNNQLLVKVSENGSLEKIQTKLDALAKEHRDEWDIEHNHSRKFVMQPLRDIHFNPDYGIYDWQKGQASKDLLNNLMLIAFFLLILGCINFINLNTAMATQRAREIGVRKTLGSSRKQIISQFMGETFLLVIFAAILSLILSNFLIKWFSGFIPEGLSLSLLLQPSIIAFVIVLLIVVTFLSGYYPALSLSKFNTVEVLKNNLSVGKDKINFRKFLTVFQFSIAQVFIIATLLVGKQINFMLSKDMGFKTEAIVSVFGPRSERELVKKERLAQKFKSIPEIETISIGDHPPASNSANTTVIIYNNGTNDIQTDLQLLAGDVNYIDVFEIELLAGRKRLNDTIKEIVINETARKTLGFTTPEEALGIKLEINDLDVPIVGVMNDFNQRSLKSKIKPLALVGDWYRPNWSRFQAVHIGLKTSEEEGLASTMNKVKNAYEEVYTEIEDYRSEFIDESIAKFYKREQKVSKLLNWATGLSIVISCLGLLGLVIYTTNRRVKEIGVRKVLGASIFEINKILCKEFIILVAVAFIIAAPIAWYGVYNWLQDFSFRTNISFWVFIVSGIAMMFFALLVISVKTIQAASVNPVNSLRSE